MVAIFLCVVNTNDLRESKLSWGNKLKLAQPQDDLEELLQTSNVLRMRWSVILVSWAGGVERLLENRSVMTI